MVALLEKNVKIVSKKSVHVFKAAADMTETVEVVIMSILTIRTHPHIASHSTTSSDSFRGPLFLPALHCILIIDFPTGGSCGTKLLFIVFPLLIALICIFMLELVVI